MIYVIDIRDDPFSYAAQEHVPIFLYVVHHIQEKGKITRKNFLHVRIGQCKQGMDHEERSMAIYETRRPRRGMEWNYADVYR